MNIAELKECYQAGKPTRSDELNLRLHRALSWLENAQNMQDDLDMRFVSLWIAFNAIYARRLGEDSPDRTTFIEFLGKVCRYDEHAELYDLIWTKFSGNIRTMLDNRYVFASFWQYQAGVITERVWQEGFEQSNKKAFNALAEKDTHKILMVVFDRLYVLRNQIVHGGATYGSSINRAQLKDGCRILTDIIPVIVKIVLNNSDKDWGKPFYPVVD